MKAHHGQSLQCSASNELTTSRENSQQDSTSLEVFCQSHHNMQYMHAHHHILTIFSSCSHQRRIIRSKNLRASKFSVSSYRNHHSVSVHQHNQYPQNVHHCNFSVAPTVSLHIGKALNLNDLEEGDDVYFECSIQVFFFMIRYAGTRYQPVYTPTLSACSKTFPNWMISTAISVDFHDEYLYFVGVYFLWVSCPLVLV